MRSINDESYADKAEAVIKGLKGRVGKNGKAIEMLTTSQIRNLLAMSADIYNVILNEPGDTLSDELVGRIEYLRIRFIYEAGRDTKVKAFVTDSQIPDILKEIGREKSNYILFNRYMEALVAFHKFYGGKEQ